ncbi:spondin-1 isoform X1 [Spodoptera frugiperda]|uniref:Spondin-1 isoform X1 n=1 Tax=Spodoptera frugiperda TaxID=7108 RepID=A0A9R0CYS4_SPOFR|nr:spondin-1 isoform X1 [Spodoptera frugiperda]
MTLLFYLFYILLIFRFASGFRCDRKPYGSSTQPSEPDGRFKLEIVSIDNNAYIPEQLYTVQITETDGESHFTSFMISAEGDIKPDPRNPRRLITMYPGELRPQSTTTAKYSDRCLYSVEQAMASYKTSVSVYWQAPPSGNGCVTLRAMVAINDEVWYEDGVPLTQKVCEDLSQPDDVAPQLNLECGICDEAKYELSFTGIWSRNTHPYLYPENDWLPRYSDLVGASHNADYILWMPGNLASEGFRDLAEHANSSVLESEIREKIGDGVRTLIKGKGHGYHKMFLPTYSFFRADKENHLFSAVVAFTPSPDWFLGVTRFELCQADNTWLKERELNLFPWDAGTDSGVSYESPNIVTYPQDSISRVELSSYDKNSPFYEVDMKDMHPFGKFHIKLIRTYHRDCEEETTEEPPATDAPATSEEEPAETSEEAKPEPEPSRYQTQLDSAEDGRESPLVTEGEVVTVAPENCPMSKWQDWSACDGECEDGKVVGIRWRERYHLVDGIPVEKYDPHARHHPRKEVSKYCKAHVATFEKEACEDECTNSEEEDDLTVERRVMAPVLPGGKWHSTRRDLKMKNNI